MGAVVMTNGDDGYWVALELLDAIAREYDWPEYLPNHTAIGLSPQAYDAYVGAYELHPSLTIEISRQDDRLYLAAPGQAPLELSPASDSVFFMRELNSEIRFTRDDDGMVSGLTLVQERQNLPAKKVARA
jgi:hypothetical protein